MMLHKFTTNVDNYVKSITSISWDDTQRHVVVSEKGFEAFGVAFAILVA